MHIYCLFLLENPLTLMEKIILSGVIKCVVIYSLHLSIWEIVEMECISIVVIILYLLMSKYIKMPKLLLFRYHLYARMNTTKSAA
jgi:hypothetical protein